MVRPGPRPGRVKSLMGDWAIGDAHSGTVPLFPPAKHPRRQVEGRSGPRRQERTVALYRLQELQAEIQLRNNRKLIGANVEVLITQRNSKKSNEAIGRIESYRVVNFESEREPGSLVRLRITKAGPHSLRGEEFP